MKAASDVVAAVSSSLRRCSTPGLVAATALAFMATAFAPFRLAALWPGGGYGDIATLEAVVRAAVIRLAEARGGSLDADSMRAVDFWARFHLLKAGLAALALLVSLALGRRLVRGAGNRRARGEGVALRLGGPAVVGMVVLAVLLVVANVQGAIAPLASLVGVLPLGAPDAELGGALRDLSEALGAGSGALLLEDFRDYHVAMAALSCVVTAVLVVGLVCCRPRPAGGGAQRRIVVATQAAALAAALLFVVVAAANVSTALDPLPALRGLLAGGG